MSNYLKLRSTVHIKVSHRNTEEHLREINIIEIKLLFYMQLAGFYQVPEMTVFIQNQSLRKLEKLKINIKSVILYINSGGGSAFASDLIARELKLLNDEKPLIAYMSDVCASGGYYIIC